MIRVADYVAKSLADRGVRHVFMVTGGGAMFLNDALGNQEGIQPIFNHHEQASSFAAEGYARVTNTPGVINVTSGPGSINAINGVFGAWTDSIPMLVISGQVKRETLLDTYKLPGLRQIGDQEVDIISMVQSITKYAVLVDDPATIRYHLEKAWYLAISGRPGPVWLDIPIDVQSSQINPDELKGFTPSENNLSINLPKICYEVAEKIAKADHPAILVGKGIRLAKAEAIFEKIIGRLQIPVATAWTGIDLMPYNHPLYCGCSADVGTRAGNFTVQNSDLLLVLGSRLSLRQVTYNWKAFARHAYKIQVDVDPAEMKKPTVNIDLPIVCDVKEFLDELDRQLDAISYQPQHAEWLAWCKARVKKYPVLQERFKQSNGIMVNPYYFVDKLFELLGTNATIVCGNGTANVVTFQGAKIKEGQRLFCNTGDASMGYDLPAAIGAAFADPSRKVICMAGDGSLQFNIQELQVMKHYNLPIILFVLNNNGYLSIRLSQKNFFERLTGESPQSGISFPEITRLAGAYGLPVTQLNADNLLTELPKILQTRGPLVCEVLLDQDQGFEPKISSKQLPDGKIVSAPMEDMYPFLSREEMLTNLLIPPLE